MRLLIIAAVFSILALSGCATYKLAPDFETKRLEIEKIALFPPLENLHTLSFRGIARDDAGGETAGYNILTAELLAVSNSFPQSYPVSLPQDEYYSFIGPVKKLFEETSTEQDISRVTLDKKFEDLLMNIPARFILFSIHSGVTGTDVYSHAPGASVLSVVLLDKVDMRPVYFNRNVLKNDPARPETAANQVGAIFRRLIEYY